MTDESSVLAAIRQIIDPELGCNLVDLGLIYKVEIDGPRVRVTMTLTTPGCPMHEGLVKGVRTVVGGLADVDEVEVDLVWEPPWTPDRITAAGRDVVGSW